jgi:hypothetical protein
MKGKGKMFTYWLDGAGESNPAVGPSKLQSLRNEVQEMLSGKTWRKRRYFERRSTNSSFSSLVLPSVENELSATDEDNSSSDEKEMPSPLHNEQESSILKLQFYRNPTGARRDAVEEDDFSQQIRRESFKQTIDEDSVISPVSHDTTMDDFEAHQQDPQQKVPTNKLESQTDYETTTPNIRSEDIPINEIALKVPVPGRRVSFFFVRDLQHLYYCLHKICIYLLIYSFLFITTNKEPCSKTDHS